MLKIHFIAIGGAAMHNLALALHNNGMFVTGSDDEIFEPSRSRLEKAGLLPKDFGWFPENINTDIDIIILGMHAREDNPELLKAKELGVKIMSYPEFLYEQTKNKIRVVVGGSHGKTSITAMIMHVLKNLEMDFDYMVGSQIDGFDTMVSLNEKNRIAIFEGDEYLSSPIDRRPKFHLYKPHIALINGIAWDHINVFPTYENYKEQFNIFIDKIITGGRLFYNSSDAETQKLVGEHGREDISCEAYETLRYENQEEGCKLIGPNGEKISLNIFGAHNIQNLAGAKAACNSLGVANAEFFETIQSFNGSKKRMQSIFESDTYNVYLDFAHAPSKVRATVSAIKERFPSHKLITCLELHTFSSLNKEFIGDYANALDSSDLALVLYSPEVVKHKKLPPISIEELKTAFKNPDLQIVNDKQGLMSEISTMDKTTKRIYLYMSSGNFDGLSTDEMINLGT